MRSSYKRIGSYVQQTNMRNDGLAVTNLQGVSINKHFMPSVANINGTDLSNYKVVTKEQFAFNPMHVGRDEVLPIAMLETDDPIIVSPAYVVFEIVDKQELLPEYLMMWCSRPEFDRNAWFTTDSSIRGGFNWDDFCEMKLSVPSIEKQREIVKEYHAIVDRIKLNERLNRKLEEAAQAIYKQWFVDFEFPISAKYAAAIGKPELEGRPYQSSGGEMVFNEVLKQEIPTGWEDKKIGELCTIGSSRRIFESEYVGNGVPFYRGKEINLKKQCKPVSNPLYISRQRYNELIRKNDKPEKNDILLTAVGTLGVSYLVQDEEFYFKDGNLIWFKHFNSKDLSNYVYDYMQSPSFFNMVEEITIGSTQSAITIDTIADQPVILPSEVTRNIYFKYSSALNCASNLHKKSSEPLYQLRDLVLSRMATVKD